MGKKFFWRSLVASNTQVISNQGTLSFLDASPLSNDLVGNEPTKTAPKDPPMEN